MNLLSNWKFWTILYLISAVLFAQMFKKANRNMKNATLLTILLEGFTALLSLIFIPFFSVTFSQNPYVYLILILLTIFYAVTDRLNIEARYGLEPSTFSMLKQLSTVFIIIFGLIFLKEKVIFHRVLGAVIIILANILLAFEHKTFKINKYFIMSIISNFLFAIAMIINTNISNEFNIAIYTFITTIIPSTLIFIFSKSKIKDLKEEFKLYDKKLFLFVALLWSIMLISSVKAYEFGNVVIVASFLALTSIFNSIIELIFNHDKKTFLKKLFISALIIVGVILVKM